LLSLVFFLDWTLFSDLVESAIHLLMLLSLVKLFGEKADRDYHLIHAISFTFLIITVIYTVSVLFFVSLIVYLFLANLTLVLFESRRAFLENRTAYFALGGYLKAAVLITVLIVVVAAPVFVAFPRSALGLFRLDSQRTGPHLSGFTDHVSLGDLGRVISDHRVFMRVQLESMDKVPADLKWRGVVLDHYDGRAWKNTEKDYRYIQKNPVTQSFEVTPTRIGVESHLRQSVSLATFSNVIFGAGRIIQVFRLPGEVIRQDEHGSLTALWTRVGDSPTYVVDSGIIPRGLKLSLAREGRIPDEIRQKYLQVPALDARIVELARRLTEGQTSDRSKALVLESFLKTGFGYTLDNPSGGTSDPLSDFLFASRSGHCEYFATSLAVMLRTLGIPSRLVNGFHLGEYNEWNDSFIVRHSDAHSWNEVYLAGAGWVEFDPTPRTGLADSPDRLRFARHFLDAVDVFWTELITFDRFKQVGFFVSLVSDVRSGINTLQSAKGVWSDRMADWWRKQTSPGPGTVIKAGILVLLLVAGWWLYRCRSRLLLFWKCRLPWHSEADLVSSLYLDLLKILHRRGHVRQLSETPLEYARRLQGELDSSLLTRVTELYYRSRFGLLDLGEAEMSEIRSAIRQIT
jgi:hypothetical protein